MTYKCELCEAVLHDKRSADAQNWDWFCGYLPETLHFCPKHSHSQQHDELLLLSRNADAGEKMRQIQAIIFEGKP